MRESVFHSNKWIEDTITKSSVPCTRYLLLCFQVLICYLKTVFLNVATFQLYRLQYEDNNHETFPHGCCRHLQDLKNYLKWWGSQKLHPVLVYLSLPLHFFISDLALGGASVTLHLLNDQYCGFFGRCELGEQ